MDEFRWEETNDALRHRGLDPIAMTTTGATTTTAPAVPTASRFGEFHDAVSHSESDDAGGGGGGGNNGNEKRNKDVVVMEKKSLAAIQETLHRLMNDCDRRQVFVGRLEYEVKRKNMMKMEG